MRAVEVPPLDNTGVGEDEIKTSLSVEDFVKRRRERRVGRDVCLVKASALSEEGGCFIASFGIKIYEMNMPVAAYVHELGRYRKTNAGSYVHVRDSSIS